MKKTYIALAVLAMAALAGCQETEFNSNEIYIPKEGEVLLRVSKSDKTTKSADFRSEVKGATISLGTADNGTDYVLEETITRLDDIMYAPATKGTPAYTENFSDLYGGFNAAVYKNGSVFEADGAFTEVDKENLIYKRQYSDEIWNKKTESAPNLYFFLRTPAAYIDTNTDGLTYDPSDGSISFSYTSPATASAQKDMLFTSRPLTTADEFNNYFIKANEGLPVLFHHALTGVKFAIAADVMAQVSISKVEFTGLADGGECVVTPRQETNGYVDDKTGDYSSDDVSIWDPDALTYGETTFSQEFSGVVSYESAGTGVAHFGDSFYLAGNKNNLNDAKASETFWFIPQPMTDNVKLTIYYTAYGKEDNWTIDFGKTIKDRTTAWYAGELHTYTIRVDDVNVKIRDIVTMGSATNQPLLDEKGDPIINPKTAEQYTAKSYAGSTKTGITITNTGNTDVYIRAAIVGQWLDVKTVDADGNPSILGDPVFGYTDYTNGLQHVDSWYQDQFINTTHDQGEFEGLVGYNGATSSYWVLEDDGYYYYKYVVPADQGTIPGAYKTVTNGQATEISAPVALDDQRLFTKYTVGKTPSVVVSGEVKEVYFRLEIATQAISAKKIDGSYYDTYTDAWDNAFNQDNE